MSTSSSRRLEEVRDEGYRRLHVATAEVLDLVLPDYCHRLIASQRSLGRCQASEAKPRPYGSRYLAMIGSASGLMQGRF
jgi:hypothetical protein